MAPCSTQLSVRGKGRVIRPIANSNNLRNTKCRRTKNLAKKSLEMSIQCDLDIMIIVYDRKFNRYKEITTNPNMDLA